jgi:ankyrin repeat protein
MLFRSKPLPIQAVRFMQRTSARGIDVAVGMCALLAGAGLLAWASLGEKLFLARWALGVCGGGVLYFVAVGLYRWVLRLRSPVHRIHRLINEGEEEGVRELLEEHADFLHAADSHGGTPLHRAALQGRDHIVRMLLQSGAEVNGREDLFGFTPLHLVACRTYRPLVAALHPELDRCDFAEEDGRAETGVAAVLLEAGAGVNILGGFSRTPLHMACVAGRAGLVKLLLDHGADVDVKDDMGFSPLHYAGFGGDGRVAKLLVEAGTDLCATAELDYTPLHTAAERGATEVARVLLDNGAEPDTETSHGRTPLALANQHGHHALAELISRHIDSDAIEEGEDAAGR